MSYTFRAMSEFGTFGELVPVDSVERCLRIPTDRRADHLLVLYLSFCLFFPRVSRRTRASLQRAHRCDVPHFLQPRSDRFGSARDSGSAVGDRRFVAAGMT